MVDEVVGTERARFFQFALVARGGDNGGAEKLCNLNGGNTYARAGTEHQHGLTGTDGGTAGQHVPGSEKDQWYARRLHEIERVGDRYNIDGRNSDQLAGAAIHSIPEHTELRALVLQSCDTFRAPIAKVHGSEQDTLAGLEAGDVLADFDDFACNVTA